MLKEFSGDILTLESNRKNLKRNKHKIAPINIPYKNTENLQLPFLRELLTTSTPLLKHYLNSSSTPMSPQPLSDYVNALRVQPNIRIAPSLVNRFSFEKTLGNVSSATSSPASTSEFLYVLHAIIIHSGSYRRCVNGPGYFCFIVFSSGHYYTYVRKYKNELEKENKSGFFGFFRPQIRSEVFDKDNNSLWYCLDDERVSVKNWDYIKRDSFGVTEKDLASQIRNFRHLIVSFKHY
jgi:hypothetical protein